MAISRLLVAEPYSPFLPLSLFVPFSVVLLHYSPPYRPSISPPFVQSPFAYLNEDITRALTTILVLTVSEGWTIPLNPPISFFVKQVVLESTEQLLSFPRYRLPVLNTNRNRDNLFGRVNGPLYSHPVPIKQTNRRFVQSCQQCSSLISCKLLVSAPSRRQWPSRYSPSSSVRHGQDKTAY